MLLLMVMAVAGCAASKAEPRDRPMRDPLWGNSPWGDPQWGEPQWTPSKPGLSAGLDGRARDIERNLGIQ